MSGTAKSGRPSVKTSLLVHGSQEPPKVPADLKGKHARALWGLAVRQLPHVLRLVDAAILRVACESFQAAVVARALGDDRTANANIRSFLGAARELGLTPSARRVVRPVEGSEPDADELFKDWVKRGGLN